MKCIPIDENTPRDGRPVLVTWENAPEFTETVRRGRGETWRTMSGEIAEPTHYYPDWRPMGSAEPDESGSTVKVRVAVAVDNRGHWGACGYNDMTSSQAMTYAQQELQQDAACYWLTADLPVPQETEVSADVEVAE